MSKWEYGGIYKSIDMDGVIEMPNDSKLKVCDLTKELPEFMKQADCLFIDPPCNKGNLRSFHTKADLELEYDFSFFYQKLFQRIEEINPKHLFLEVFKSNREQFIEQAKKQFKFVTVYDSFYYNNRKNTCWILHCTNDVNTTETSKIENIDEEKAIKWICENLQFDCIGDLCMGRGLVGKYAYLNGKKFVGTELNKKRLAVLVDFINKKEIK